MPGEGRKEELGGLKGRIRNNRIRNEEGSLRPSQISLVQSEISNLKSEIPLSRRHLAAQPGQ
jgi:hypothetical protein